MPRNAFRVGLLIALALASTACPKPKKYGDDERPTISPPASSLKPSGHPTTPSPTPEESPTVEPAPGPESEEHEIAAVNGNVYDTYDLQARVGDTVLFRNKASDGNHSFTIDGTKVDSGSIEGPDGRYRFKVTLAKGEYTYHCTVVPYMVDGKLIVY
jgi:plastocyanin